MTREQAIMNFVQELAPYQMHGFLLLLHGQTLAEGYYAPFRRGEMHRMYSVSKSVVSLAIGMLAEDGVISLDDFICDHFSEWVSDDTPELLRKVRIRDMLRMATCYDRSMYGALRNKDWTRPFFEGKPTHIPGTLFSYDTSASQVMCALVERKTGRNMLDWMRGRLFDRIGMTDPMRWLKDGVGTSQGGTGLLLTLRDFSTLANFCMGDGAGLVSAAYLRAATSRQIATDERSAPEERFGYGYQFWQTRHGFAMYGLGGQMAVCIPEKQLCLCTLADLTTDSTGVQPIYDAFFRHLAQADELESAPQDAARLKAMLSGLHVAPVAGWTRGTSTLLTLTQGTLPFSQVDVRPDSVTLTMGGMRHGLPYVPGAWRESVFPNSQERCFVSGGWRQADRFELHVELCGAFSGCMKLFVQCAGECASVRVVSSLGEFQNGWSGQDWGNAVEEQA